MNRVLLFIFAIFMHSQTAIFANKQLVVEVPMKFRGIMPAVEVFVNGEGPFLFAIDTGGQGEARADASLVEKLKLKTVGEVQAGDGSGQNLRTLNLVEMNSIKIGDLEFKNVQALTRNYNESTRLPKIDGILGFNLFKDYLFTLDYPNKKVLIEKGELPKANNKDILDYSSSDGIASIELKVGTKKVNAHIDSGNLVSSFILPTEIVEQLPQIGEPKIVGQARTVSNTIEIKQTQLKDSISFGQFVFKEPFVTYPALRDANIGSQLLQEFSITFDQKTKRLKLKRTEPAKKTSQNISDKFKDFIGTYENRTISEKNGVLYIQRQGGPELKLNATGVDKFVLADFPTGKIEFIRNENGKVHEIKVLNPRGEWETSKKND